MQTSRVFIPMAAIAFMAVGVIWVNMADEESRGVAMGLYATVQFLGFGLGPALFAPLMNRSYVAGFTACAIAGVVLAGLSLLVQPSRPPRPAGAPAATGAAPGSQRSPGGG